MTKTSRQSVEEPKSDHIRPGPVAGSASTGRAKWHNLAAVLAGRQSKVYSMLRCYLFSGDCFD